ncbi:MAG TPA: hypothetical protein VD927_15845 [Chryseosolibacter sp.]|nr:hypothetical protein [Chryseosolibacter sp.]
MGKEHKPVQYIRIPKSLYSTDTGKPIDKCLMCEKYLLVDGTPYMIEKAVRQIRDPKVTEVIFEYAMCMDCMVKMNNALSVESRQRINNYFETHADMAGRSEALLQRKRLTLKPWINTCLIKGTPISESSEYQIVCQCDGKNLLFTYMPFALSFEAMDEITGLLSAKTLGEIDDFTGKYFTGPPEVSEILKRRVIVL